MEKEGGKIFSIDYGAYFPIGMSVIGWIIPIIGLMVLYPNPIVGICMLPIGPCLTFVSAGLEINFETRSYREFMDYFGIKKGETQSLNDLDYISMFRAKYTQRVNSRVSSMELDIQKIEVQLVTTNRQRIFIQDYHKKEEAIKLAYYLSDKLKVKILDATEHEQKWIEKDSV